jgi:EAL domain-containing protein (putative c-di-GMP-specific phosphodiesterase class I)
VTGPASLEASTHSSIFGSDIEERVRSVIADESLRVVFQPIFELDHRRVVGYEALARFRQMDGRSPAEWFADAHRSGAGGDLELAAVGVALAEAERGAGPGGILDGLFVSVNASPSVVCSPQFGTLLDRAAPRHRTVVEITEHAAVEDYARFRLAFEALGHMEVHLAIDDVGAGFASLRHILGLEPEIMKLDRSLVHGLSTDPGRRAIAKALLTFAEETDLAVVAEGIETEAELRCLGELGAGYGQGYHLARPAPLAQFAAAAAQSSPKAA